MVHPGFTYPDNICFLLLVAYIGGMQKVRFSLIADIEPDSVRFVPTADICEFHCDDGLIIPD